MCLMCEWYFDSCWKPECWEAASGEEKYEGRGGHQVFLHKGYSVPCEHMRENHGPECDVILPKDSDYGLVYDSCNCDWIDDEWVYY
jgi:hypothetical protein